MCVFQQELLCKVLIGYDTHCVGSAVCVVIAEAALNIVNTAGPYFHRCNIYIAL